MKIYFCPDLRQPIASMEENTSKLKISHMLKSNYLLINSALLFEVHLNSPVPNHLAYAGN